MKPNRGVSLASPQTYGTLKVHGRGHTTASMLGTLLTLFASVLSATTPAITISDNDYGQATVDFSIPPGATLTNTVTWTAVDLQGRGGLLFLRFETASTVELLPVDLTVTFGGNPVPALKVGFNAMEFHVATIADLGTGGTISYAVTFNKELDLNNSGIGIMTLEEPSASSNQLAHHITVMSATTVDVIKDILTVLPVSDFRNASPGLRIAMLNILDAIGRHITKNHVGQAIRDLANLRSHVDGCGLTFDSNDWIVGCAAQTEIRSLIDSLAATLGG